VPKRTDIKSVLIIGAGPIVIGQACEFDYSGAQACKALREEGLQGDPGQLQSGDHHDRPGDGRRHLHRADQTGRCSKRSSRASAPNALLPTMGGQTGLNCALDSRETACSPSYKVEMIGASSEAIDKAEDREKFKQAMGQDRPRLPAVEPSRTRWMRHSGFSRDRLPGGDPSVVYAGRLGRRHRL